MTRRQHFVHFVSPGTFFAEEDEREIAEWSAPLAARMAKTITQRHGATPYGFYFTTAIVADPISDGSGGTLKVEPKTVKESGMFFLTGTVRTIAEIAATADPNKEILLSNMRGNKWNACVENTNSYKSTHPFCKDDVVIDWNGKVTVRGADFY